MSRGNGSGLLHGVCGATTRICDDGDALPCDLLPRPSSLRVPAAAASGESSSGSPSSIEPPSLSSSSLEAVAVKVTGCAQTQAVWGRRGGVLPLLGVAALATLLSISWTSTPTCVQCSGGGRRWQGAVPGRTPSMASLPHSSSVLSLSSQQPSSFGELDNNSTAMSQEQSSLASKRKIEYTPQFIPRSTT